MQQVLEQPDQVRLSPRDKHTTMATTTKAKMESGHLAAAKALNLPVSTKHCIEICRTLRFKDVSYAKQFLQEVVELKRAVPFKRFVMNMGHKKGMSTGRSPVKAASEILKLLKSVESNAHFKGLNTSSLKITKFVANRAPIPMGGGRHSTGTKRTHVEVEVKERGVAGKKKVAEPVAEKKEQKAKETVKHEQPTTTQHDHAHEHGHDHASHAHSHTHTEHKHEHAPAPAAKPAVKAKMASEEPSSADLLRRAQQKAAELKQQEKTRKDTQQVENLYEELQKKGSLRSEGVRK